MLSKLKGKKIVLVGFEATNKALYAAIRKRFPRKKIGIADQNKNVELPDDKNIITHLGDTYLKDIDQYDVIVRSPSVRYWPELQHAQKKVTTATQMFFEEVRGTTGATIIGITGTKGKSTTATLLHETIKLAGKHSFLVGNIDNQDWDIFDHVRDDTYIVYELSSYMLMDFTERPDISIMLNVFPDHLDWHQTFEGYVNAKGQITAFQNDHDLFIFNAVYPELVTIAQNTIAQTLAVKTMRGLHQDNEWFYDGSKQLFPTKDVALKGFHNRDNLLFVLAAARQLGIEDEVVHEVSKSFKGLPHRLEEIARKDGVTYVDDAISTTPESTIAAIRTFPNLGSIILGGEDRGYDFTPLAKELTARSIGHVVLLPGARNRIKDSLDSSGFTGTIHNAENMKEAVEACIDYTPRGHVALLSTAAPSFDKFKDYKDQGEQFKKAIVNSG